MRHSLTLLLALLAAGPGACDYRLPARGGGPLLLLFLLGLMQTDVVTVVTPTPYVPFGRGWLRRLTAGTGIALTRW